MATYLRPGVSIEETLQPLSDPTGVGSNAVATFVGVNKTGGPVGPTLVTSFSNFQALFGDIKSNRGNLGYAVYSHFLNGGGPCFIVRALNSNATSASLTVNNTVTPTPAGLLKVTAKSAGTWASSASSPSRVFVTVAPGSEDGRFDLTVEVGQGASLQAREQFIDLSLDPLDGRNAIAVVNSPAVGSGYVALTTLLDYDEDDSVPATVTKAPLTGGGEGTGNPDLVAAVERLEERTESLTLNLPGVTDTTTLTSVIGWAEDRGNVFVVVDGPASDLTDTPAEVAADYAAFRDNLPKKSVAAVYGPWLVTADPAARVSGAMHVTAPGGLVTGLYARSDSTYGIQKAPAGVNTPLGGVINPVVKFTDTQLDALNPIGVNVIRNVPGYGACVMGARTLAAGSPDRYVNVRRTLIAVKRALVEKTQFAVFRENDEVLWESIEGVLDSYLRQEFQAGTLAGGSANEAYFVKCDSENNPPSSAAAGIVNIEVGVAISSPAEFIVIKIGQYDGGATVVESE